MKQKKPDVTALMAAWDRTIEVQQHFNDICWRIRSLALTALTFILGGTFYAYLNAPLISLGWFGKHTAAVFIPLLGLLLWIPFERMDTKWYHVLLRGAVNEGRWLESMLRDAGIDVRLSSVIRHYSRYRHKDYKLSAKAQSGIGPRLLGAQIRPGDAGKPRPEPPSPNGRQARDKLAVFYRFGYAALIVTTALLLILPPS